MGYILTLFNTNSPDYMASLCHAKLGTSTIICRTREITLNILEKNIILNDKITGATIKRFDSYGNSLGTTYWNRESDGSSIDFIRRFVK